MADKTVLNEDNKADLYLTASLLRGGEQVLGGYKRELVTQQLSEIELQLLVCHVCSGFMRNACNTIGGAAMGCETCVGTAGGGQAIGTVRTMVSNLKCICPLREKGCMWDGSIGEVEQHLDVCSSLVVVCAYSVYGCPKKLRRGDLQIHRREGMEYHTELMSIFMREKISHLEGAKRVQGEAIRDLQDSIQILRAEREYMKPNGVLWRLSSRSIIEAKVKGINKAASQNMLPMGIGTTGSQWNGNTCIGPMFELDSQWVRPELEIVSADIVSLQIVQLGDLKQIQSQNPYQRSSNSHYGIGNVLFRPGENYSGLFDTGGGGYVAQGENVTGSMVKWPLRGKCKVLLINPTNRNADWIKEINTSQLSNNQRIKLVNIPSQVLLDGKYNNNDIIEMQILFKTPYSRYYC